VTPAAKVTTALRRLELGHFSNVKDIGVGVFAYRSISDLDIKRKAQET